MEQDFVIDILNEEAVKDLVVNICLVLTEFGITEVHVGGLMRLVGIEEELAAQHDDELMVITDIQQLQKQAGEETEIMEVVPPGTTVH
jgi:hypothetical protein